VERVAASTTPPPSISSVTAKSTGIPTPETTPYYEVMTSLLCRWPQAGRNGLRSLYRNKLEGRS